MNDGASNRQPTAFISHHSSQVETARRLKVILSHHGITGWIAPDDINPGQPFDKAIVDQVRQSDLIILLFCEQSDQSRHVKRELMMAEDADKLIFPVRLEDKAADGLAYWLNDYQWIDWFDGEDDTITRMIETIKSQSEEQSPAPAVGRASLPSASTAAEPPPAAPAPVARSQWPVPIASAVIVALIMLVGFYFMTRDDDGDAPVEIAAAEGSATGEDSSDSSANSTPDPAPPTVPPPMPTPITPPPPALPSPGTGDFYVMVGSFQPGDPTANQRARDFEACSGMTPIVAPSENYAGFAPGLIVVMTGGYADAREANAVLSQAQSCIVDAYIRQAR